MRQKHPCSMARRINCWANKSQSLVKKKTSKSRNSKWPPCTTPKIKKKPNPDSISNPIKITASNTSPTAPTNATTNSPPPKPTSPKPFTATVSSPTTSPPPAPLSTKTNYSKWQTSKATETQLWQPKERFTAESPKTRSTFTKRTNATLTTWSSTRITSGWSTIAKSTSWTSGWMASGINFMRGKTEFFIDWAQIREIGGCRRMLFLYNFPMLFCIFLFFFPKPFSLFCAFIINLLGINLFGMK